MKNYGVVFDVDDTLYDMSIPFLGAYQSLYGTRYRFPTNDLFLLFRRYSDERFDDTQTGKMSMEALYAYRLRMTTQEYGVSVTDEEVLEFQRRYVEFQYRIRLTDTMKHILDTLREKNVKMGVITNGNSVHQREKIKSLNLAHWIPAEHVIVSGDHDFRKPDVRIFREMERRLDLPAERLLYVGDAFALDIPGACHAGWHTLWFNHRHRIKPDDTKITADIEVHSEEELSMRLLAYITTVS